VKSDEVLPLDAFVRSVGVNRSTQHHFFLGAGASVTSGVPSAQMCIWEWKRDIFLTNNVGLEEQFTELSLASVRQRIQRWLDKQGIYPAENAADEYSAFIEACYPIPDGRRAYFEEKIRKAQPHIGYQLLCLLSEAGLIRSVWTTNFDALTARAAAGFKITPIEVGIDSRDRIARSPKTGELLIVSVHGDYRYDRLTNTARELKELDARLLEQMTAQLSAGHVIVIGYSGRDFSVMKSLETAFRRPGPGALYWCIQEATAIPDVVLTLIQLARSNQHPAYVVPTLGFDDLMVRLALHCATDERQRRKVNQITQAMGQNSIARRKHFEVPDLPIASVIKSNAFELECTSEVLSLQPQNWPEKEVWKWVRETVASKPIVAVPYRSKVLALGMIDDLREAFKDNFKGEILRIPLSEVELRYEGGPIVALMRNGLVRAIAGASGVKSNSTNELWIDEIKDRRTFNGIQYLLHDSVLVWLRWLAGKQYVVLKPSLKILGHEGAEPSAEVVRALKQDVLGWQHNKEFNDAMNMWRSTLFGKHKDSQVRFEFPNDCGSTFAFTVRRTPLFAEVGTSRGRQIPSIDSKFRTLIKQRGIEIGEPRLAFASRSNQGWKFDTHPVRGILNNRPFDYSLTSQGLGTSVRMGVVCPETDGHLLFQYLSQHSSRIPAGSSESDYLPTYPGFGVAFGLPLEVPEPGSAGWITCNEPDSTGTGATVELAKRINRCIDVLQSAYSPHVILVFFPERWHEFRGYTAAQESFDLHDFVKAYGVQRGVGTQFLEESTLHDPLRCRVWWWLSLAFYVKAMRTPWVLEGLERNTAFVGLGLSSKYGKSKSPIVIGCSHIYSSRGEGLQYRVSKVENPVFYGKNPFLSREDARRVAENIRELFFESRGELPNRVVIHKRTRFTTDERLGIGEGLNGVADLEMLEVVIADDLRYVASTVDRNGRLSQDNYPVVRGTTVKLDDFTALLWVHGATSVINPGRRYYQGKRRIPAPLMIRRYAGESDLQKISEEILGLSKMNWNTFDLYTKLPATVHSSNEIARVGSLLERFGSKSYDYRLFI
jgi:hypothetical protein